MWNILKVYVGWICEHVPRTHISHLNFWKLENECPRCVPCPENVYLEILCPCLYVPINGGARHRNEKRIETQRWWTGRSLSLRGPDVDISKKHRLQIECICAYHCILRGTGRPINHTPRHPWGLTKCRDCVSIAFWYAYALYRLPTVLARLWLQTCFFFLG